MRDFKQKAVAILIGIVAAAVLLEISLAILGYFQGRRAGQGRTSGAEQCILCLGDSFVFGVGAPSEKSYPAQLEELLNAGRTTKMYRVINAGMQGQNTAQILETLPETLAETRPRVVVLLSGGANIWNYRGYYRYRKGNTLLAFLGEGLSRIRVYKLVNLMQMRLKSTLEKKKLSKMQILPEIMALNQKAQQYLAAGDNEAVARSFVELIRLDPLNPENYHTLSLAYIELGRWKEAFETLKAGIYTAPEDESNQNYEGLVYLHRVAIGQDDQMCRDIRGFLRYLRNKKRVRNLTLYGAIDILDNTQEQSASEKVIMWLEHDIQKIVEVCRAEKIDVILVNYPENNGINAVLAQMAQARAIPLADVHSVFGGLLKDHSREEYFIADGHCNAKGYGVMASIIYKRLLELKYVLPSGNTLEQP